MDPIWFCRTVRKPPEPLRMYPNSIQQTWSHSVWEILEWNAAGTSCNGAHCRITFGRTSLQFPAKEDGLSNSDLSSLPCTERESFWKGLPWIIIPYIEFTRDPWGPPVSPSCAGHWGAEMGTAVPRRGWGLSLGLWLFITPASQVKGRTAPESLSKTQNHGPYPTPSEDAF